MAAHILGLILQQSWRHTIHEDRNARCGILPESQSRCNITQILIRDRTMEALEYVSLLNMATVVCTTSL